MDSPVNTDIPQIKLSDLDEYNLNYKLKVNTLWEFFKHTEKFFIQNIESQKLEHFENKLLTTSDDNFKIENEEANKLIGTTLSNPIYLIAIVATIIFSLQKV